MSVIDLESEGYRWLGPLRYDLKGVAELITCNSYRGKISYVPLSKESITVADSQIVPSLEDKLSKPALNFISKDDESIKWTVLEGDWSFFCACSTPKVNISSGSFAKHSHIADGTVDLILAPQLGRIDLTVLLSGIEDGSVADMPFVQYIKTRAFKLEQDLEYVNQAPISLDGERAPNSPVQVEVHQAMATIFYDYEDNIIQSSKNNDKS